MPDLFLSYAAADRVSAKRLYDDLSKQYPQIDVLFGHEYIPIQKAAAQATHFVLFRSLATSPAAEQEMACFLDDRKQRPRIDSVTRTLFQIPLDAAVTPSDSGAITLEFNNTEAAWSRLVRTIGESVPPTRPAAPGGACPRPPTRAGDLAWRGCANRRDEGDRRPLEGRALPNARSPPVRASPAPSGFSRPR